MTTLKRFTAFVLPAGCTVEDMEEIDVDAACVSDATHLAEIEMNALYAPGSKIVRVDERIGWYL